MIVFTKTIHSEKRSIETFLHEFKIGYLKWQKIPDKLKDKIEFSLMEAIENAHEHGNKKDENKTITIRCWRNDNVYKFSVTDCGKGFSPQIPQTPPPISDKRGRGLYSISTYADSVSFNESGNTITFTFISERES